MGSFNVACSISNLSINEGDRIKFFILKGSDININSIEGNLLYGDTLMKPVALPISGIYNDYGRIKGDDTFTNNLISKYFDLELDEIADRIIQGERINDNYYSGMFVLEDVYNKLVSFSLTDDSLYTSYLTTEVAEKVGFKEISKEEQYFNHPNYNHLYRKEGFEYDLLIGNYGAEFVPITDRQYYIADHRFLKELHRDWEDLTKTSKEEFPIDINNITDSKKDYEIVRKKVFDLTGISLQFSKKSISMYSVESFEESYEKLSGISLDLDYLKRIYAIDEIIRKAIDEIKNLESLLNEKLNGKSSGLGRLISLSNQLQTFKGWSLFDELYTLDNISNKELKEEIRNCIAFDRSMYSCNRFYFPAMNGEQFGNSLASKALLDISTRIIADRLKEECEE